MEGFTYVDIFATKGIEYLLIIGYLVLFIVFLRALRGPRSGSRDDGGKTSGRAH